MIFIDKSDQSYAKFNYSWDERLWLVYNKSDANSSFVLEWCYTNHNMPP